METRVCKVCGKEKPVNEFSRNGFGYTSVCAECANAKKRASWDSHKKTRDFDAELQAAKTARLSEFEPRELIEYLRAIGYRGKLEYTKTYEIKL